MNVKQATLGLLEAFLERHAADGDPAGDDDIKGLRDNTLKLDRYQALCARLVETTREVVAGLPDAALTRRVRADLLARLVSPMVRDAEVLYVACVVRHRADERAKHEWAARWMSWCPPSTKGGVLPLGRMFDAFDPKDTAGIEGFFKWLDAIVDAAMSADPPPPPPHWRRTARRRRGAEYPALAPEETATVIPGYNKLAVDKHKSTDDADLTWQERMAEQRYGHDAMLALRELTARIDSAMDEVRQETGRGLDDATASVLVVKALGGIPAIAAMLKGDHDVNALFDGVSLADVTPGVLDNHGVPRPGQTGPSLAQLMQAEAARHDALMQGRPPPKSEASGDGDGDGDE